MKEGPPSVTRLPLSPKTSTEEDPLDMLHAGLDLGRKKLDVCLLDEQGRHLDRLAVPPDVDSLGRLAGRIDEVHDESVCAAIESMTGARLVHDTLEQEGWAVAIADAQKVKRLAPLACKTDRIDSMVLAVLAHRDLVPAIWLADPRIREERELARFRLHLVKHKSALKNRIHSTLIHPYIPLLLSAPGIGWVLAFTIAAEIGEIERFPSPEKLAGYTGLCPRVNQSGDKDRRGPLTKHGPTYLRWALLEATMHALKHPAYAKRYQRNKRRLGKQRGAKVAQVDIARRLTHAIWHMLTRNEEFAPRGAAFRLAA
jgi:transposase